MNVKQQSMKLPPHSMEAELAVLGGLLLDEKAWERVSDKLIEEDFYRKDHRIIWRAIADLQNRDKPSDIVTVNEWLVQHNLLEETGGLAQLTELANGVASAANIASYAEIIREKSVLRALIDAGSEITENAFHPNGRGAPELLESAEQAVFSIAERHARGKGELIPMEAAVRDTMRHITELCSMDGTITGLPTGFVDLDNITAGLQRSDLIIIAGRPSMGKTTLAMNIAEHAAIRENQTVLVFSMEMSAIQLTTRLLSSVSRVEMGHLRNGNLSDMEMDALASTKPLLDRAKIYIDETPAQSPNELRAKARRLKREHGLGLVVVDYIQLMQVPGNNENRTQEIGEISRGLKALAKELDVPVIALSQLNRSVDSRTDKRPVMSDLRESGSIEQDADLIAFIYRDYVYNKETPQKNKAEVIIAKQRNGETGKVNLVFRGEYTRFENYAPEFYADQQGME